jgi:hypothetical protein
MPVLGAPRAALVQYREKNRTAAGAARLQRPAAIGVITDTLPWMTDPILT